LIEGHTDATKYSEDGNYSNWELSADRANAARRLLQEGGVRADQVTQVRGYADQLLRVKTDPFDPSNRRISILVKNDLGTVPPLAHAKAVEVAPAPVAKPGPAMVEAKPSVKSSEPAKATETNSKTETAKAMALDNATKPRPRPPANPQPVKTEAATKVKPPAGTPAAGPTLMTRLKAMLPGKKN
jgi:hypothetical protein